MIEACVVNNVWFEFSSKGASRWEHGSRAFALVRASFESQDASQTKASCLSVSLAVVKHSHSTHYALAPKH